MFGVKQRVDDVFDWWVILDMVESCGCRNDCMSMWVPVLMLSFLMKSRSRAAWMSPRKME